jgi:hypothetical protein
MSTLFYSANPFSRLNFNEDTWRPLVDESRPRNNSHCTLFGAHLRDFFHFNRVYAAAALEQSAISHSDVNVLRRIAFFDTLSMFSSVEFFLSLCIITSPSCNDVIPYDHSRAFAALWSCHG